MSLVSFYQAQVALCTEMALNAKTDEIKMRWIEEADTWRRKADGVEVPARASSEKPPSIAPSNAPLISSAIEAIEPVPPKYANETDTEIKELIPRHDEEHSPRQPNGQNAIDGNWLELLAGIRSR